MNATVVDSKEYAALVEERDALRRACKRALERMVYAGKSPEQFDNPELLLAIRSCRTALSMGEKGGP